MTSQDKPPLKIFKLFGPDQEAIDAAKHEIDSTAKGVVVSKELKIDKKDFSQVIGRNGKTMKVLKERFKVTLEVEKEKISIGGLDAEVELCDWFIKQIIHNIKEQV